MKQGWTRNLCDGCRSSLVGSPHLEQDPDFSQRRFRVRSQRTENGVPAVRAKGNGGGPLVQAEGALDAFAQVTGESGDPEIELRKSVRVADTDQRDGPLAGERAPFELLAPAPLFKR